MSTQGTQAATADDTNEGQDWTFLNALFGAKPADLWILIWTLSKDKKTKQSFWCQTVDEAVKVARRESGKTNVYFGVGLSPEDYGQYNRCEKANIAAIAGVWADFDIAGEGHQKPNLPPTQGDVIDLIKEIGLPPTTIVHSGGGVHAYWNLSSVWAFGSDDERIEAQDLCQRWNNTLRAAAKERGWDVDATHDLSRVLRVPNTQNLKAKPIPVKVLFHEPKNRYDRATITEYCRDDAFFAIASRYSDTPVVADDLNLDPQAEPDPDALGALLENCDKFRRTWEKARTDFQDQSGSSYDLSLVSQALKFGWSDQDAVNLSIAWRRKHGAKEKLRLDYYRSTLIKAKESTGNSSTAVAPWQSQDYGAGGLAGLLGLTDLGNGRRLAHYEGSNLRHVETPDQWFAWTGTHWTKSGNSKKAGRAVYHKAIEAVRHIYGEAQTNLDPSQRKALGEWAARSEGKVRMDHMIEQAKHLDPIAFSRDLLDREEWRLACLNGEVCLKTGALYPSRRESYFTGVCPVNFNPDAKCPKFEEFILWAMRGDEELVRFLQRAIGYAISGSDRERCVFILHGGGSNGKTTLLNAVMSALGDDFAWQADKDLLTHSDRPAHTTGLVDLAGRRFVAVSETEQGGRLAESLLKFITGNGRKITARKMRSDNESFAPTFSIFLDCNHLPHVRGRDDAIWDRLVIIPFEARVEGDAKDPDLGTKLEDEAEGILAWAVRGSLEYHEMGLQAPATVKQANREHFIETDDVGDFIADHLADHGGAIKESCSLEAVYSEYAGWSERRRQQALSYRVFNKELRRRGMAVSRLKGGGQVWEGKVLATSTG